MLVTLLGIVMLVREVQSSNILTPMLVTLEVAVKMTVVRLVQPSNTLLPILVTLVPIVAVVRLVQYRNA